MANGVEALDAAEIIATVKRLGNRIRERFPDASLGPLAGRLLGVAERAAGQADSLLRPNLPLRVVIVVLVAALPATLIYEVFQVGWNLELTTLADFVPFVQAAVETLIFLGAGIAFLVTLETRLKRSRAFRAFHELRVLAHLVDMHQLDKDPVYLAGDAQKTASSPERTLTAFELGRYFDYCSELLSLIGKLAALYGQNLVDPASIAAVDQIESLTTGLSRKIWQKSTMLPSTAGP